MNSFEVTTLCISSLSLIISSLTWFFSYKFMHKPYILVDKIKKNGIEYLTIQNKSDFPVKRVKINNMKTKQLLVQEIDYLPPEKIIEIDVLGISVDCQYELSFCQKCFNYKLTFKL